MFVPQPSAEQAAVLSRFERTKLETSKMDRRDQELLDKQMRKLTPPRNDGVIAVLLAAMFLVGMTLGSVLSEQKTEPIQIASIEYAGADTRIMMPVSNNSNQRLAGECLSNPPSAIKDLRRFCQTGAQA